tara:strand:- start:6769 stop:6957 length:189 start_codon:yes stop_codon:yes gene_type:complete
MKSNKTETIVVRLTKEQKDGLESFTQIYSDCNKSDIIRMMLNQFMQGSNKTFYTKTRKKING